MAAHLQRKPPARYANAGNNKAATDRRIAQQRLPKLRRTPS
jgi:hypothetical protein